MPARCRLFAAACCCFLGCCTLALSAPQTPPPAPGPSQEQAPQAAPPPPADEFFAGTVVEMASDHLAVSRAVQGKIEKRAFRIVPETKVEGRLRLKVRVTVRYQARQEGETATLIIVRGPSKIKK